jgi:predicted small lipoprotein YifL
MKQSKRQLNYFLAALALFMLTACGNKVDGPAAVEAPVESEVAEPIAVQTEVVAEAEEGRPAKMASRSQFITAVVAAINHETRELTLTGADGQTITFTASDEARNLDQVNVGDRVNAEYTQTVSIEVVATENAEAAQAEIAGAVRSEEGEMPGVAAVNAQVEVLVVEAINIEANTFKVKDVNGVVTEYVARDPENLKRSKVGDSIVITVSEAFALSVTAVVE